MIYEKQRKMDTAQHTELKVNIYHLKNFIAASREGSFNRAAKLLDYAPQTISSSIRQLEKELGMPLFERSSKGLELTSFGLAFLREAQRVESGIERLEKFPTLFTGNQNHLAQLKVGMSTSSLYRAFCSEFFSRASFDTAEHTSIFPISCAPGDGLLSLDEGMLDALVFETFGDQRCLSRFEDMSIRKIATAPLVVAVSRNSALANKSEVSLTDLSPYSFVSFTNHGYLKLAVKEKCAQRGFTFSYLCDPMQKDLDAWSIVENDDAAMFVHSSTYWDSNHPRCAFLSLAPDDALLLNVFLVYKSDHVNSTLLELETLLVSLYEDEPPMK